MTPLAALLFISILGIGEPDCSKDGKADMREVYRESLEIMDRIELERQKARGGLTEDAIELRSELREKQDELREWTVACSQPVGPRRTGRPLK